MERLEQDSHIGTGDIMLHKYVVVVIVSCIIV